MNIPNDQTRTDREFYESKDLPTPGSRHAVDIGCRCPVLDNGHGQGPGPFWVNGDCPVHGHITETEKSS